MRRAGAEDMFVLLIYRQSAREPQRAGKKYFRLRRCATLDRQGVFIPRWRTVRGGNG
jgi:hypothetical protein